MSQGGARAHAGRTGRPWVHVCTLLILGVLTTGAYLNTIDGAFVFDDHYQVVENTSIRNPFEVGRLLRHFGTRPLVNVSYAFDYAQSGLDPSAYHKTNIALHVLNVFLLYFLALVAAADGRVKSGPQALTPWAIGVIAAAFFAVHPLMTEAVAFVSSRAEVLCSAFFLSGVLAGRRALLNPTLWRLALMWLLLLFGLLSKELAVMLPLVLWLYDRWLLEASRLERRTRLFRVHLPVLLAIGAAAAMRLWVMTHEYDDSLQLSWQSAVLESEMLGRYGRLFVWPAGLSLLHQIDPVLSLMSLRSAAAVATLATAVSIPILLRKVQPIVAFGGAWFLLVLLPSAALAVMVQRAQLFAEHRAYLAGCGLFLCAGVAVEALWRWYPRWRPVVLVASAAGVVIFASATVQRNELWRHPVRLWGDAVKKAPHTFAAQYGYARALHSDGDFERAVDHYRRAIAIKPQDEGAYQNLALCLIELRQPEQAAAALEHAKRLAPETLPTRQAAAMYAAAFGTAADLRAACAELQRIDPAAAVPPCRTMRRMLR